LPSERTGASKSAAGEATGIQRERRRALKYGKTSLSNVFWRRYGTTLQTIIAARVQADPSDTFSSLWIKGLEELRAFAVQSGRSDLIPIETEFSDITPDVIRRELQKCRPNAIPILIIDEFDKLQEVRARELTANVIKSLHDYAVPATIILVGVAENVGQLEAEQDEH
jgi:hypothetical protein